MWGSEGCGGVRDVGEWGSGGVRDVGEGL